MLISNHPREAHFLTANHSQNIKLNISKIIILLDSLYNSDIKLIRILSCKFWIFVQFYESYRGSSFLKK